MTKQERVTYEACMGLKCMCLGLCGVSLKVEEDQELNMVFTAVTQISAKRHFWKCELKSWCLRLGLMFRVENQSLKGEYDLRTPYLRTCTRECT